MVFPQDRISRRHIKAVTTQFNRLVVYASPPAVAEAGLQPELLAVATLMTVRCRRELRAAVAD